MTAARAALPAAGFDVPEVVASAMLNSRPPQIFEILFAFQGRIIPGAILPDAKYDMPND
jgi:hypothetical protein